MPSIRIDPEYFRRLARQDYHNWRMALIREFVQNSVDAGASLIRMAFRRSDRTLTVIDNGCGMTRSVLENKLLCMGGTTKLGHHTLGCFGKAKEILFFGWEFYRIVTKTANGPTWRVDGVGSQYEVGRPSEGLPDHGTVCTIHFGSSRELDEAAVAARRYLAWCEMPCKTILEEPAGSKLLYPARRCPRLAGHELRREIPLHAHGEEWATLRVFDCPRERNFIPIIVRSRGVLMLSESRWVPGTSRLVMVCEALLPCHRIYTANRESLIWDPYGRSLGKMLDEATIDFKTFGEEKAKERRLFRGYGALIDRQDEDIGPYADAASYLLDSFPNSKQRRAWLSEQTRQELLRQSGLEGRIHSREFINAETLLMIVNERLWNDGQPDLLVVGECPVEKLRSRRYVSIGKAWTELVRLLAEPAGVSRLSVGFVFDESRRGLLLNFGKMSYVLVNPVWVAGLLERTTEPMKIAWTMLFEACHEIAHHRSEVHGEGFTLAISELMEKLAECATGIEPFGRAVKLLREAMNAPPP